MQSFFVVEKNFQKTSFSPKKGILIQYNDSDICYVYNFAYISLIHHFSFVFASFLLTFKKK